MGGCALLVPAFLFLMPSSRILRRAIRKSWRWLTNRQRVNRQVCLRDQCVGCRRFVMRQRAHVATIIRSRAMSLRRAVAGLMLLGMVGIPAVFVSPASADTR